VGVYWKGRVVRSGFSAKQGKKVLGIFGGLGSLERGRGKPNICEGFFFKELKKGGGQIRERRGGQRGDRKFNGEVGRVNLGRRKGGKVSKGGSGLGGLIPRETCPVKGAKRAKMRLFP